MMCIPLRHFIFYENKLQMGVKELLDYGDWINFNQQLRAILVISLT